MSNYKLYPDGDKKQVNGNAITASSTKVDGGSAFALGTGVPSDSVITGQLQLGGRAAVHGSQVVQSKDVFGAFQSSATSLTSVGDNGSGKARFTLAGHVLAVGDVINVSGSTSGNVDGVQKVTAVAATTFDTDKDYTAAATAGSYTTVAGRFADMTEEVYLIRGYTQSVANGQYTYSGFGSDHGIRRSIHKLEHMRTRRVATAIRSGYWNEYSGTWSTDPTVADDVSSFGTDNAANPTRAIPGELVYRVSGQPDGVNGINQDDYEEKTGG